MSLFGTALPSFSSKASNSPPRPCELRVLGLIVRGKSAKDIANLLGISVSTVSAHRTAIGRTLKCHNNAELVAFAI